MRGLAHLLRELSFACHVRTIYWNTAACIHYESVITATSQMSQYKTLINDRVPQLFSTAYF